MTIEERTWRLESIEAIRQLKARYFNSIDTRDLERLRTCFASSGVVLDLEPMGRVFRDPAEMIAVIDRFSFLIEFHHGQNAEIELTGPASAKGFWGLYYFWMDPRERSARQVAGHYRDTYVAEDGVWKIQTSHFHAFSHALWHADPEGVYRMAEMADHFSFPV